MNEGHHIFPRQLGTLAHYHLLIGNEDGVVAMAERTILIDGIEIFVGEKPHPEALESVLFTQQHERAERQLIWRHLRQGHRVIELGSGLGLTTCIAAKILGPNCVRSFEANDAVAALARNNLARNGLQAEVVSQIVIPERIWSPGMVVDFIVSENFTNSSLLAGTAGRRINCTTLPFEKEAEAFKATFLIIDIEGGEIEFLRIAQLEGIQGIVVELHPSISEISEIIAVLEHLRQYGYLISPQHLIDTVIYTARDPESVRQRPITQSDPTVLSLIASMYLYQGEQFHSLEASCLALETVEAADLEYKKGLALEKLGRLPEAVTAYERAVSIDPGIHQYHWHYNQLKALRA